MGNRFETVDDYTKSFPAEVQVILEEARRAVRRAAPQTEETISYQIPTFTLNGKHLVYLAGWKQHIGLYPIPALDGDLEQEVARYRSGKDTLRFPLNEPLPHQLVEKVVSVLLSRRLEGRR